MNHHTKTPDELRHAAREALDKSKALYRDGFRQDAQEKFAEATTLANLAAEADEAAEVAL